MGDVLVPEWARWGAQTQRAVDNFPISGLRIERRLGETFACAPLAELAMWRQAGSAGDLRLHGRWRGEAADLTITKGGA